VSRSRSPFRSPRLTRERNDGVALYGSCRPPTHLRTKVNSSRRRCTRCRSDVSVRRIWDHAQGCSKYPRRHSSRSSLMAASLDRRAVISASTFCRSTLMSVAPATPSVGWPKASFSSRKSNWPRQALPGPMLNQCPPGRGVGKAGIDRGAGNTSLRWPVRPAHDIAGDNLGVWHDCKIVRDAISWSMLNVNVRSQRPSGRARNWGLRPSCAGRCCSAASREVCGERIDPTWTFRLAT